MKSERYKFPPRTKCLEYYTLLHVMYKVYQFHYATANRKAFLPVYILTCMYHENFNEITNYQFSLNEISNNKFTMNKSSYGSQRKKNNYKIKFLLKRIQHDMDWSL